MTRNGVADNVVTPSMTSHSIAFAASCLIAMGIVDAICAATSSSSARTWARTCPLMSTAPTSRRRERTSAMFERITSSIRSKTVVTYWPRSYGAAAARAASRMDATDSASATLVSCTGSNSDSRVAMTTSERVTCFIHRRSSRIPAARPSATRRKTPCTMRWTKGRSFKICREAKMAGRIVSNSVSKRRVARSGSACNAATCCQLMPAISMKGRCPVMHLKTALPSPPNTVQMAGTTTGARSDASLLHRMGASSPSSTGQNTSVSVDDIRRSRPARSETDPTPAAAR